MDKKQSISVAMSVLLNCPLFLAAAFAQQQNLSNSQAIDSSPGASRHLPVDEDDDNLPDSVRRTNETLEEPASVRSSGAAVEPKSAGQSSGSMNGAGNPGTSIKLPGSATAAGYDKATGTGTTAADGPSAYLHHVARSFDRLVANGGHAPVRILPAGQAPKAVQPPAQPAVDSTQANSAPQAAPATGAAHGVKSPAVPQLSSLRTPVWRETSSAEQTVEPEHGGAADTTSSSTSSAGESARKAGGTAENINGQKLAMAGGAASESNPVEEISPAELMAKLFKRPALLLDAQVKTGHVTKEQLAKIVAATPPVTYKSKADKAKEAAARLSLLQGNHQAAAGKFDPRQPRKTGSSVLLTPALVSFDLDEVLRALKRENSLIDLKSIGETIMILRRAVTDHPAEPSLRIKLGSILLLAGDFDGAATEMKHAIVLKPKDYRAHLLLAFTLDAVGDHETAASAFRRAIELAPNAPEPHTLYADSLLYQGDVSAAINEYRRAIGVKPSADSLAGLAEALIMAQDKVGCLKAARQAVSLDPSSAKAHVALTKALILNGEQAASMRTARQAVLLSPALADSHIALGRALHAKGDLDDAVDEFKQAVALDPLNAQARNDLGYALYSKGDMLGAVAEFRIALRLNPRLGEARNNLEIAIHRLSGRKVP